MKSFKILIASIAMAGCAFASDSSPDPNPPNVLLIMADDLGYGDLSCYGATDLETPHIDKLASEGMRFTKFYANCCVCSPTRAALLSGRYPEFVGVPGVIRHYPGGNWGYLTPDSVMLPAPWYVVAGDHCSLAISRWREVKDT